MEHNSLTTFQEHLLAAEVIADEEKLNLLGLTWNMLVACKSIHNHVTKAGLLNDALGLAGRVNTHGDEVKKLDEYAHDVLVTELQRSGQVAYMASEEEEGVIAGTDGAPFIVVFDPLDGSSNIDANVSVGTIFSVYRNTGSGNAEQEVLRAGGQQLMAGYVIYGSSTMLVYTVGEGTHGFTFDPAMGEFYLSHEDLRTPEDGRVYSINEVNEPHFSRGMKEYLAEIKASDRYTGRYIGSLVADFHRNLLYGGIYAYMATPKPKLRLLYEGFPMAWIVEQAGGAGSNGKQRLLDMAAKELHERVELVLGSKHDVHRLEELLAQE